MLLIIVFNIIYIIIIIVITCFVFFCGCGERSVDLSVSGVWK